MSRAAHHSYPQPIAWRRLLVTGTFTVTHVGTAGPWPIGAPCRMPAGPRNADCACSVDRDVVDNRCGPSSLVSGAGEPGDDGDNGAVGWDGTNAHSLRLSSSSNTRLSRCSASSQSS